MKINEIAKEILKFKSILIFSHTRPDGDTLGCAFSLKLALESLGKKADIVCEQEVPEKYRFLKIAESLKKPEFINESYEAHIAVDVSVESLFGRTYPLFMKNGNTFNIDHHISNTKYAKFNYVEDVGACCMIIYKLINEMGAVITKDIADCLLLGISTDTGHFAYSNVTEETLNIAGKLVKSGGDLHEINYLMFKNQKKERALLYGKVMSRMKFYLEDKLAIITIRKSDLEDFNANSDMTEGFIDFPLSVEGVEVAISVLETDDKHFKISYRSKGKINVNQIASTFGGGGHILASGSMLNGYYEDVIDKLVYTVGLYL